MTLHANSLFTTRLHTCEGDSLYRRPVKVCGAPRSREHLPAASAERQLSQLKGGPTLKAGHHRLISAAVVVAASPLPAVAFAPPTPWYEDYPSTATPAPLFPSFVLDMPDDIFAAPPPAAPETTAKGVEYTWLTHPCPSNPFRCKVDEEMMYIEPTLEQRQLAMAMGLPLRGA